ncbi:hypothetical protein C5B91_09260 [Haloferax sp. Atlit-10N]|uniref:hypothetical protein n=1 Tax=unclassified Haloferax TaxID=2625095 RepID=UPI000E22801E|nr:MULTISPECIES: hypothetical protein [unclassified Haloferax]RDZ44831.1 hypothetical protein C5B87_11710 [Haloferax sp. Atlit-16N]RDZ48181.1 hypothetical protein C5B86_03765 [Haloferax sp. Atlit-19N]RDZ59390.1 hypothetical protein C5B91_09260 [Haloferax sp. Atlit-10N]
MADTHTLGETSKRLGTYALIAVALGAPFGPFWYVESTVGRQASFAHIGGALLAGTLVLLCGLVVLERYAGVPAKTLASFDGFFLGLNAGVLYGEWLGLLGNASAFPGLAGALVWSLGVLEIHDRIR